MVDEGNGDTRLRRAIGQADLCELMSAAFSFPDRALSSALVDGAFACDAVACLIEVGADGASAALVEGALAPFADRDPDELQGALQKTYSLMYLTPGSNVPVFPYEGAFRYVEEGRVGSPTLFRSPVTLDVERHMREAGVVLKNMRTEPCDSVYAEFEFMSYLLARRAEAIECHDSSAEAIWDERYRAFSVQHAAKWIPAFIEKTRIACETKKEGGEYAALALFASQGFRLLPFFSAEHDRKTA